jgi:HK97 family phage prohead protease
MTKMSKEIRSGEPVEIRAEGNTISVSGYAAVFNSETIIGGSYREQIAPGAFADAIGRDDVMFLINHDGLPMARTKSGTLMLAEDERGLYMSAELDSTDPDVRAIVPKMKRGDLDKMSFAFMPEIQSWDDSGDMPLRTIRQASLFDVSIVTYPAYQDTDIGLRSLSEFRSAQETKEIESNPEAIAARLRMKLALSQ